MPLAVRRPCRTGSGSDRPSKHHYILVFHASSFGLPKRVELASLTARSAIELARSDAAERIVDIWQDGEFFCRVSGTHTRRATKKASGFG